LSTEPKRRSRIGVSIALVSVAVLLVLPSSALAGSLARDVDGGGNVTYTFAGGAENDSVTVTRNTTSSTVTFSNPAASFTDGGGLAAGSCTGINTTSVSCPGTASQFVLNGNSGNDAMTVTGTPSPFIGPVTMTGGVGTDTLTGAAGIDTLNGGDDGDTLTGNEGNDILSGVAGNDTLNGNDGNDTLSGGDASDTLNGGNNDDTLTPGLGDDNTVTGGDDIDLVSYDDGRTSGVVVSLAAGGGQNDGGVDDNVSVTAREELVGIENVTGTTVNDSLTGDIGPNTLRGLAGNDAVSAGAGNDILIPGLGDDGIVDGGTDTDTVSYDDGRANGVSVNLAVGGQTDGGVDDNPAAAAREDLVGIENVTGSGLGDTLTGDSVLNVLSGLGGGDIISGAGNSAGTESLLGGPGNDVIDGGDNSDVLNGDAGEDQLTGGEGTDILTGGTDSDRLDGGASDDTMNGSEDGGGADVDVADYSSRDEPVTVTANVGSANDGGVIDGASPVARDTVTGVETVLGGSATDTLTGDDTGMTLNGGASADVLTGGEGADSISGGSGTDTISALGGSDFVDVLDGLQDTVDCGDDPDEANADIPLDLLTACETVGPDEIAPDTTITKRPANRIGSHTARFKFTSSEPGSTFECKRDKKRFKPCSSPTRLRRLREGKHRFKVRAIDSAGNVDPTPARDGFRVTG
jgi:Ca2+-binding RTX toxin-like protein